MILNGLTQSTQRICLQIGSELRRTRPKSRSNLLQTSLSLLRSPSRFGPPGFAKYQEPKHRAPQSIILPYVRLLINQKIGLRLRAGTYAESLGDPVSARQRWSRVSRIVANATKMKVAPVLLRWFIIEAL